VVDSRVRAVKASARIEKVIAELGFSDPNLTIDPERQRYRLGDESGDVFEFLKQRFGWSFGRSLAYLENRLKTNPLAAPLLVEPAKVPGRAVDLGRLDKLAAEAMRLGADYPGGLAGLLEVGNFVTLIREGSWMPSELMPLVGIPLEGACSLCDAEFTGWQELGQAYVVINREEPGEIIRHDADVYCSACVKKMVRWRKALALLVRRAQRLEERAEVNRDSPPAS